MTLNLISLATVKSQLGITASTYDSALTALIPIVSSDIRRILNTQFNCQEGATFTIGSTTARLPINAKLGTVIDSPYTSADTYITAYDPLTGNSTISAVATASGNYYYPTVNIAQWPAISKMIWYKYSKQNTTSASEKNIASVSAGPVSTSYAQSEINKTYDYPQKLIDDLGPAYARVY